eukprot:11206820-Lingulodinium_polyedra.AAC.1
MPKKAARVQQCLRRALRERDRAFTKRATARVLIRESKGTVFIRARAATGALESKGLLLGL